MTGASWGKVHVGDTVRGADQRAWEVVGRCVAETWALSGQRGAFLLRRGERTVSIKRALSAPVDMISRADHTAEAGAIAALIETGIRFDVLEEHVTQQAPADPFSGAAPAAADAKIKRDQWGRYLLPDPETGKERAWTRASTVARTLADEYNLARWGERMVAKGLGVRPDLVAGAAAAHPDRDKSTLDGIAKQAKDAAQASSGANFGTALHSFTERYDRGESLAALAAPAPLDADLRAYAEAMRTHGLKPRHIERIVVVPELGVAGKFDRLVGQPPGATKADELAVLDLKTAKSVDYSWLEMSIQLGIYSHGAFMWDPVTGTYEPMPAVDQARALVLHLPVGCGSKTEAERARARGLMPVESPGNPRGFGPQLYGVNITKGWEYAQIAVAVRAARSSAKQLAWLVEPDPEALLLHRVARAADRSELGALWEHHAPAGEWTETVHAAAQARLAEIEASPAA